MRSILLSRVRLTTTSVFCLFNGIFYGYHSPKGFQRRTFAACWWDIFYRPDIFLLTQCVKAQKMKCFTDYQTYIGHAIDHTDNVVC